MFKLYALRDPASKRYYYSPSLVVSGTDPQHAYTSKDRPTLLAGMMGSFLTWPGPLLDRPLMPEIVEFNVGVPGDEVVIPAPLSVPMLLWCPECSTRHIDDGEFATKIHHTHSCQSCGHCWRPAVVATTGVQFLPGFKNLPPVKKDVFIRWRPDGFYLKQLPSPSERARWVKYPADAHVFSSRKEAQAILDRYPTDSAWGMYAFVEEI